MRLSKLNLTLASVALIFSSFSMHSSAVPITVGGGWTTFGFGDVGSAFYDEPFTFTLESAGELKVTDAFNAGDRFAIFDLVAGALGETSDPLALGDDIGSDYDGAFADPRWSSGLFALAAGSYSITGTVTASPYGSGGAALRVDLASATPAPVPLPGTLVLIGLGLAGLGWSRRKAA